MIARWTAGTHAVISIFVQIQEAEVGSWQCMAVTAPHCPLHPLHLDISTLLTLDVTLIVFGLCDVCCQLCTGCSCVVQLLLPVQCR